MSWGIELTWALIPSRHSVEIGWRQEIAVTATLVATRMELQQEARIFLEHSTGEAASQHAGTQWMGSHLGLNHNMTIVEICVDS